MAVLNVCNVAKAFDERGVYGQDPLKTFVALLHHHMAPTRTTRQQHFYRFCCNCQFRRALNTFGGTPASADQEASPKRFFYDTDLHPSILLHNVRL